jgi:CheY-like chemotaxis protein
MTVRRRSGDTDPSALGRDVVRCQACAAVMPATASVCPGCHALQGTADGDAGDELILEPGLMFHDRYLLQRGIGSGGMAAVWLAIDKVLGQPVAIKFLSFESDDDLDEYLARFRQEIRLARSIHHPGIVANYDMGEYRGRPYLTMEAVNGTDLSRIIRREHPLAVDRIIEWLVQLGGALGAAHAEGIVHRDLKSSNIIVDQADNARILDFGIARQLLDPRQTLSGRVVGTPLYIAPEAAMEKPDVDHRSDIYSFGILAYEMCTSTFPFKDENPVKILLAHIQQRPMPPGYHRADLPAVLEEVILRCIAKEPGDRYQNVLHAIEDLRRAPSSRAAASAAASGVLRAVPQVLVVDDDGTLRLLLKTLFQGAGLSVTVVPDAELAMEKLNSVAFQLLVTDLVLPGKSGHDLASFVQTLPPAHRPPIVIMTSLEEEEIKQRSEALGVAGHLTKPLSIDEFTALLKRFFPAHAPDEG